MRYKVQITDFFEVGGVHFYGSIYKQGVKVHELDRPDPAPLPRYTLEYRSEEELKDFLTRWRTIKFPSRVDVLRAAKDWFENQLKPEPGDKLVVDRIALNDQDKAEVDRWHGKVNW